MMGAGKKAREPLCKPVVFSVPLPEALASRDNHISATGRAGAAGLPTSPQR